MAGSGHASYTKVGAAVFLGVAAIIGLLVYFGGYGDRRGEFFAETYYDDPVSGLSVGSEVNFRGVKVGEVRDISFVGAEYREASATDRQRIYVKMALGRKFARLDQDEDPDELIRSLVAKGLRATVSESGITGLSRIELNLPKGEASAVAPLSWEPASPYIPPAQSVFQSFSESATQAMDKLKQIDFAAMRDRLTSIADSFSSLSEDVGGFVAGQKNAADEALSSLVGATRALKEFSEEIRDNPSLLLRPRDPDPMPETER